VGIAASLESDDERSLQKPADLEKEANLAEAKRVEAELQAALENVRARREEMAGRLERGEIDTRGPERTSGDTRIVNGVATWAYPATGALIKGASAGAAESWCTGTLIGCRTFLTANHCVHDDRAASKYHVYLQTGGIYDVESISPERPDYNFPQGDLAVIRLGRPVEGITPIGLNTATVRTGPRGRSSGSAAPVACAPTTASSAPAGCRPRRAIARRRRSSAGTTTRPRECRERTRTRATRIPVVPSSCRRATAPCSWPG
jgi:hypothetical protein